MANDLSGNYIVMDTSAVVYSPASAVQSSMVGDFVWMREMQTVSGVETDALAIQACQLYLLYVAKTFPNLKLLHSFCPIVQTEGSTGESKLRWASRHGCDVLTTEAALQAVGYDSAGLISDDWSGTGTTSSIWTARNQALAAFHIQVYRAW